MLIFLRYYQFILFYIAFSIALNFIFQDRVYSQSIFSNEINLIELNDQTYHLKLGKNIQYIEDKNQTINIHDLLSGRMEGKFFNNNSETINLGFSDSIYWIKLDFSSAKQVKKPIKFLLKIGLPILEHASLYLVVSKKEYKKINKINGCLFNENFHSLSHIFPITIKPDESLHYYIRICSDTPLQIPIEIFSYHSYFNHKLLSTVQKSFYFGMMFILLCINLYIFFDYKNKIFLYNGLLILSLFIFENIYTGFAFELLANLFHENILQSKIKILLSISICFICIALTVCSKFFIHHRFNNKILYKLHTFFIYISIGISIISIISSGSLIIKLPMMFFPINTSFLLIAFALIFDKEDKLTRLLIISWLPFFTLFFIFSIISFGLFSGNWLIDILRQYSCILMGCLFSIALLKHLILDKESTRVARENDISLKLNKLKQLYGKLENIKKLSNDTSRKSSDFVSKYTDIINQKDDIKETTSDAETNIKKMVNLIQEANPTINEMTSDNDKLKKNHSSVNQLINNMSTSLLDTQNIIINNKNISENALEIATSVTSSINNFEALMKDIVDITDVIKKISERIDILAVNAAIEAASAGEAGKGFSVVANEIAKFSEQSGDAADNISQQIEKAQLNSEVFVKKSNEFSILINELITESINVSEIIKTYSDSLNYIYTDIENINNTSNNMSSFIEKSLQTYHQYNDLINIISKESKVIIQYIQDVNNMIEDNHKHNFLVIEALKDINNLSKTKNYTIIEK